MVYCEEEVWFWDFFFVDELVESYFCAFFWCECYFPFFVFEEGV